MSSESGPRPVPMPPWVTWASPPLIYVNEFVIDLAADQPLPDSAVYYRGGSPSLYDFVFYWHPVLGPSMPPRSLCALVPVNSIRNRR